MPHEVKPPPGKKPNTKGKPLGIPIWGWIAGAAIGILVGYYFIKKGSGQSADSSSGSDSSPLGGPDSGDGGGSASPPSIPPTPAQVGGGNGDPTAVPSEISPGFEGVTPIGNKFDWTGTGSGSPTNTVVPGVTTPITNIPVTSTVGNTVTATTGLSGHGAQLTG
jgi:hypothetical protein